MKEEPVVIEISDFPQMDTGAPCPLVLADEYRVVLSYLLPGSADGPLSTIISFESARTHSLGSPSEETLHGHPLWGKGLKHYGAFRVEHSPLIRDLQAIDSVHRYHKPEIFRALQHFIIPFHDTTFECVSRSFVVTSSNAEIDADRLTLMVQALNAKRTVFDDAFWKVRANA
jgi:hypothetical protein